MPEDTGIRTVNYSDYVDTSQENQDIAEREGLGEFGKSSPNGELKTAILYHGSYADFGRFDFEAGRAGKKEWLGRSVWRRILFYREPGLGAQLRGQCIQSRGKILYSIYAYCKENGREKRTSREHPSGVLGHTIE